MDPTTLTARTNYFEDFEVGMVIQHARGKTITPLENVLIKGIDHETISLLIMHFLNEKFDGRLQMAIEIFTGVYPKRFLHQLVSGQLDAHRRGRMVVV